MITDYGSDVNGDNVYDLEDNIGLLYSNNVERLFTSAGGRYSETGNNGNIEITVISEKSVDVYERIYRLVNENPGLYFDSGNEYMVNFANGNIFATNAFLSYAMPMLRDMKDDFAIVPLPKRNTIVSDYESRMEGFEQNLADLLAKFEEQAK